jgi:hypothetical protein
MAIDFTNKETDGQRVMDAAGWLNECLCAEYQRNVAFRAAEDWKQRFADAIERLEGKLHCGDTCKCSGRQEIELLQSILAQPTVKTNRGDILHP